MIDSMKTIYKKNNPKAMRVTNRFYVQKLSLQALQDVRRKLWDWRILSRFAVGFKSTGFKPVLV